MDKVDKYRVDKDKVKKVDNVDLVDKVDRVVKDKVVF